MPSDPPDDDIFQVAVRVGRALDAIGVLYAVVGSVASSILGDPRTTNDVDIVCALLPGQVAAFSAALGEDFDIDQAALREAMASGSSWSIFFNPVFSKVDLFALDGSAFQQSELRRARRIKSANDELVVLTAEDCVLSKLRWFRDGGGVSSQQWRDVLGMLRVAGSTIARAYLAEWSRALALEGLLRRALDEAKAA